ncbi:MAG: peptidoglycan-binding protein [Bryobacteraceae bacterium]|nr:peptidoglycan-binding protein [Bryobacteraceae bacterium]
MRGGWIAVLCALSLGWAPTAAQQRNQSTAAAKSSARIEKQTFPKRSVSSKRLGKPTAAHQRARRGRTPSWRLGQQQPTPERYREIQEALIARGYLEGPPSGSWGPESIEALRKFQQDNRLEPTGKINSLSLIALGLGPKRDSAAPNGQPRPEALQP